MVKIVRFHETGAADVLKLDEMEMPEPGKGEVRLRVKAIGLNRAEVMFRMGQYLIEPVLPSLNGYEASGIVEAVGEGVDRGLIGQVRATVPGAFAIGKYGTYGEVTIMPQEALVAYPEKLSFAEGTSVWMQYLTAYGALVHYEKIGKGDFVLITAASSSVGIAAIEIAKAEGAVSIATTRTASKKAELLGLGADHVIVTDDEDLVARVMEITGGKGCRVVFDPVGGPMLEKLTAATAVSGIVYEYGALSTEPTPFPLFTVLSKFLRVKGYTLFEFTGNEAWRTAAEKYIFAKLESGAFNPKIDKEFSLSEIVKAHEYMESNAQIGKIVVTV